MSDYGARDYVEDQSNSIDHLLIHEHEMNITTNGRRSRWPLVLSTAVGLIVGSAVLLLLTSGNSLYSSSNKSLHSASELSKKTTLTFSLVASNEYGSFDGKSYPWMSDVSGTQLVEPYKNTTLVLTPSISGTYTYKWSILSESGSAVTDAYTGDMDSTSNSQEVVFVKTGIYLVKIHLYNSTGLVHIYTTRLVSK